MKSFFSTSQIKLKHLQIWVSYHYEQNFHTISILRFQIPNYKLKVEHQPCSYAKLIHCIFQLKVSNLHTAENLLLWREHVHERPYNMEENWKMKETWMMKFK